MNMNVPFIDLIKKRCSWRSFSGASLPVDAKQKMEEFLANPGIPPFNSQTRFELVDAGVDGAKRVPGTYGVIKGARDFIVGAVKPGPKYLEDYGYLFEKAILFATALDLGSCWMGGTLKHTIFAEKIGLQKDEALPCICPVGIRAPRKTLVDAMFAAGAGSMKRKPWHELFFLNDFSNTLSKNAAGEYSTPLEMVRLAPSASNRQPWRIIYSGSCFHLFLTRNKAYKNIFKSDLQRIDMGIAMCHFELSAKEKGLEGCWTESDPGLSRIPERTEYVATWKIKE
ncbi:Nitroreductase family protein [Desulfatibacillum alkenivorans DSM 16219]|jgi:nitroreductase|uniref:Nitroreductase family protein n=1 Tax=Desulfatibacillum alkenivorans DSM 16219 TaxID=1121393 RepID=A0A1M6PV19_9BACT|nr:nitroreductase family protein [Desulfatibacillum alkenivorans]SHK11758.1 Nitroreductase family protein [Desulfatibacillum alkenivorans DSM 16219]